MFRRALRSSALVALAFAASGCGSQSGGAGTAATPAATAAPTALPAVAAYAAQPVPAWITEVSPRGNAPANAQIRVRFASDVIPLEALEAPDRQAALAKITIEPALPGHFLFVTPRMVSFEADAPVPRASRIAITLHAGLKDRAGHVLDRDVIWNFTTEALALAPLPNSEDAAPQGARPRINVSSNVALDEASLADHATLIPAGGATPIPLVVVHDPSASPSPQTTPTAESSRPFAIDNGDTYTLAPQADLPLATRYEVRVAAGVRPKYGNLPLARDVSGRVRTYGPLTFDGVTFDTSAADRALLVGVPQLAFSNGIDPHTIASSLTLAPAAAAGYTVFGTNDDDTAIRINPAALQPNTHYTVTVAKTLTDQFGQHPGDVVTATFDTTQRPPSLWAPAGFRIFPASAGVALSVATVNLPQSRYRARYTPVSEAQLIDRDPTAEDDLDALIGTTASWPQVAAPPGATPATTAVPLSDRLGAPTGLLAYGVGAGYDVPVDGKPQHQDVRETGAVQVTDVGIFAQWFPSGGFVRAHHLSDGSPIAGARVDVYESKPQAKDAGAHRTCASGRTDATGTLVFDGSRFARCLSLTPAADDEAPALLAIVHDGRDWAFVRTATYGQGLGDAGYAQWSSGTPHARGAIVSDRQLYQRGEDAYFTAVGYFETNGVLGRGASRDYAVTLTSPKNATIALGRHALDAFGAFSVRTAIPRDADLGDWTIAATGDRGESFSGSFTVAQFKPPNFAVSLALDRDVAAAGETVTAEATSTYLFGAPVDGGRAHVFVTRTQSAFRPKGFEAYAFGPSYEYPEEPPALASDVLQRDAVIGAAGKSSLAIAVGNDLPYAADYTVETQTTDVSNLAVSATKTFTALPRRESIGLRGDFVGQTGETYPFDFVVVDPTGSPVAGQKVHVVLQHRIYDRATQLVEGSETQHTSVRYEDVAQFDVTSTQAVQHLHVTPAGGGSYRLRANFANATSEATASDQTIYVAGADADWLSRDESGVRVELDKPSYRPGDVATALVASPYAKADVLFAVVRHGVIARQIVPASGSARVHFVVTSDMVPNAVVEAVVVRQGPSLAGGVPAGLTNLARTGFAALHVAVDQQYVKVTLAADRATVGPGERQHVRIHVADGLGRPVAAELTLAVANDAILQLSGYRFPDLVQSVYADEPVSTRFGDNRGDVKLAPETQYVDKGFGYGGGTLAGPASTRVRTQFRPVAYFTGNVRTDASGDASIDFAVPDDLTTWRVLALGLTRDARFGTGDTTFIATKPLVTNPVLPQFARPGDTLRGGVAVTNVSAGTGDIAIDGTLGGDLAFVDPAGPTASLKRGFTGPTEGFRFDMRVPPAAGRAPADGSVRFTTALGSASDAFAVPLPIVTDDVLEDTVDTGTTKDSVRVPFAADPHAAPDLGGLHLTLASTLLGDTFAPVAAGLRAEPYPFSTEYAARIAIAADGIVLDRRYGGTGDIPALQRALARDRERLRPLRRPDGSYAVFSDGPSDVFTSAFVAVQLATARSAGVAVGDDIRGLRTYLTAVLADPARDGTCHADAACVASVRLEALETLAALGDVRADHLTEIVAHTADFSLYEQVELARHLVRLPAWHAQGLALRDRLLQQLFETGRRAELVTAADSGETAVDGQSQLLGLMIETKLPGERIDRAFTSLLSLRGRDGTWGSASANAEALNAVTVYAAQDRVPPDFTAAAHLGTHALSARFKGYAATSSQQTIAARDLPAGPSVVTLAKTGTGTLHYTLDYEYGITGASAGTYAGIRIERIVRRAGSPVILATFGLAAPAAPLSLPAASVYDIEDRITTDRPLEGLVVADAVAAGLEPVDARFATSTRYFEATGDWNIDYQTIERNRVITYAASLEPGVYAFHYLARTVTPGTFAWPAARASLALSPDEFGRTAASSLAITE